MLSIKEINIAGATSYSQARATIVLTDASGTSRLNIELNEDEIAEVQKTVREILATQLRRPMIIEKMEAARTRPLDIMAKIERAPVSMPPAVIETPIGPAEFTPDGYKFVHPVASASDGPEEGPAHEAYCNTHHCFYDRACSECEDEQKLNRDYPTADPDPKPATASKEEYCETHTRFFKGVCPKCAAEEDTSDVPF